MPLAARRSDPFRIGDIAEDMFDEDHDFKLKKYIWFRRDGLDRRDRGVHAVDGHGEGLRARLRCVGVPELRTMSFLPILRGS